MPDSSTHSSDLQKESHFGEMAPTVHAKTTIELFKLFWCTYISFHELPLIIDATTNTHGQINGGHVS